MTHAGIGSILNRLYTGEAYLLLKQPIGDSLQRSILMGLPSHLRWPSPGHADIDSEVAGILAGLRDSEDFAHRLDILQHQWSLLGPLEASSDLERFLQESPASGAHWAQDAAFRLRAATEALSRIADVPPGEAALLESVRTSLTSWMASLPEKDLRELAYHLSSTFWVSNSPSTAEARSALRGILDAEELAVLPGDIRRLLAGD